MMRINNSRERNDIGGCLGLWVFKKKQEWLLMATKLILGLGQYSKIVYSDGCTTLRIYFII